MAGDCFTDLAGFLLALFDSFLLDLRMDPGAEVAVDPRVGSKGEVVTEVSDRRTPPYTELWFARDCACSAGEVRGLKASSYPFG